MGKRSPGLCLCHGSLWHSGACRSAALAWPLLLKLLLIVRLLPFFGTGAAEVSFPHVVLKLISDRPQVLAEAIPYARIRGLSLIATLCSTVSFATFRGLLDFRTPLRVSLAANMLNACLVACPHLRMSCKGEAHHQAVSPQAWSLGMRN